MICPLHEDVCVTKRCGWWDDDYDQCSIRTIADSLALMVEEDEDEEPETICEG